MQLLQETLNIAASQEFLNGYFLKWVVSRRYSRGKIGHHKIRGRPMKIGKRPTKEGNANSPLSVVSKPTRKDGLSWDQCKWPPLSAMAL